MLSIADSWLMTCGLHDQRQLTNGRTESNVVAMGMFEG